MDEHARRFLQQQRVAHLATADAAGAPHVVPICFVLIERTVYIAIDEKPKTTQRLRRLRNIAENPRVAIVVDHYDDADWTRLAFVMLRAIARIIEPDSSEHLAAVAALRHKYPQYRDMALDYRPVIAATVTSVTTWGRLDP